jgi:hypothetical protein
MITPDAEKVFRQQLAKWLDPYQELSDPIKRRAPGNDRSRVHPAAQAQHPKIPMNGPE